MPEPPVFILRYKTKHRVSERQHKSILVLHGSKLPNQYFLAGALYQMACLLYETGIATYTGDFQNRNRPKTAGRRVSRIDQPIGIITIPGPACLE